MAALIKKIKGTGMTQKAVAFTLALALFGGPAWAACAPSADGKPSDQYVITGGTVYDKNSDLTWARCSVGQQWQEGAGCVGTIETLTWSQALKRGEGGWRVPTVKELETLIARACSKPAIDENVFQGIAADKLAYWSGTEVGSYGGAWAVSFLVGTTGYDAQAMRLPVRLVRSGK
jgi:hypothetical protein